MSSASDLVSLEQDTGLVKKMQERYILIWNLSKPTQTMIALIVTRLSEDDHLHCPGPNKNFQDVARTPLTAEVVSRWFPVFGPLNGPDLFSASTTSAVFFFSEHQRAVRPKA